MQKPRLRNATLGLSGLGLAVFLQGCCCQPAGRPAPAVTLYHADGSTALTQAVRFGKASLGRRLRLLDVRQRLTAGGLLNPGVTLETKGGDAVSFEYRFAWFDAAGYEVGAETESWKPVTLSPRVSRTLEAVAPAATVTAFELRLRPRD